MVPGLIGEGLEEAPQAGLQRGDMKRRYPKDVVFASLHGEYDKARARYLAKLWTSKGKRATHKRERREAKRDLPSD